MHLFPGMTTINVTLRSNRFDAPRAIEASRAYAHKGGAAVELSITKRTRGEYVIDGYVVRWNATRGRGWSKGWKRTCATLEEAATFAAGKWPTMLRWLARTEVQIGGLPGDWTCSPSAAGGL